MQYKVLIPTSGIGSRLGELTDYTNKSLISVGGKTALSYIIERYPKDVEFVITLGYFGDLVKDFLEMAYTDRKFSFVYVDNYAGEGSSLVYSMLQAKDYLQCPFIFNACDTLVINDEIPAPDINWVAGFKKDNSSHFASFDVADNFVKRINKKGELNYDYVYIGLSGIYDYEIYWQSLKTEYEKNKFNNQLSDVNIIESLLQQDIDFESKVFTGWLDIGNIDSLRETKSILKEEFAVLNKKDEAIYFFDDFVIKFFSDTSIVNNRVLRADKLKGVVPEIIDVSSNFYKYKFVEGDLFSSVVNVNSFNTFLKWCRDTLWESLINIDEVDFYSKCYDFYYTKTLKRINKLTSTYDYLDKKTVINGVTIPSVFDMMNEINFEKLCTSKATLFHGDLILDNVLKTKDSFCLIDWRQDFAGEINYGDVYYDLAKLNHNLVFNHDIINKNLFSINITKDSIECDLLRSHNLFACQKVLFDFIRKEGYDENKIRLLTPLIWLNMSPLHEYPLNIFLFCFGKLNLYNELCIDRRK